MDRRSFLAAAAGLALAPRALAELAPRRVALVTADLEHRLVVVDLASGRVLRHLATLDRPRSIETVGAFAVVAHSEIGAITIVRAETLRVRHVLEGFGEPRYTAAHPDGRHAYVTDAKRGEVICLDVIRGRVLSRTQVGDLARHVSIDPSARRLWVALGAKAELIAVVDVSRRDRPRLVRRIRPPFLAHDVGFAPDGRRIWVSSGDENRLAIYDRRTGRMLASPAADLPPQHITFRGDLAFVTSGESGTLRVHGRDGRELRLTPVPKGSYNVQQRDSRVVTPGLGNGSLCILDGQGRLLRQLDIARSSHDACIVETR
ncbi:MAG: YncE family protein [Gaiellaceae bacterium]